MQRSRCQSEALVLLCVELPVDRRVVPQANVYRYRQQIPDAERGFERDLSAANLVLAQVRDDTVAFIPLAQTQKKSMKHVF